VIRARFRRPFRRLLQGVLLSWERLLQAAYYECRPDFRFITAATHRALKDRLAADDSPDKTAIVLGQSVELARALGLHQARLLILDYPDFTLENLALASDGYDFLIADRALHRCASLDGAACETLRVLRPGGWFVQTTSVFDLTLGLPAGTRRMSTGGLRKLFSPGAMQIDSGTAGPGSAWIVGRKAEAAHPIVPAIETIASRRRWYPRASRRLGSRLGVLASARNEAPYLLEWIAHYRVLGFDRIIIYDNDSNDASWRILQPLAKAGEIEAVFWRVRAGKNKQRTAYNHALARLRQHLEWCLVIDLDEFLVLDEGVAIADILPAGPEIGAVAFPWRLFGSGGHQRLETGLTIERFTRCAAFNSTMIKSIVRPRHVTRMLTHVPRLSQGRLVDVFGNAVRVPNKRQNEADRRLDGPARIHHYCTRSREEFDCKRARGRAGAQQGVKRPSAYFAQMDENEMMVTDALRLAPAVRQEVERLRRIVQGK